MLDVTPAEQLDMQVRRDQENRPLADEVVEQLIPGNAAMHTVMPYREGQVSDTAVDEHTHPEGDHSRHRRRDTAQIHQRHQQPGHNRRPGHGLHIDELLEGTAILKAQAVCNFIGREIHPTILQRGSALIYSVTMQCRSRRAPT